MGERPVVKEKRRFPLTVWGVIAVLVGAWYMTPKVAKATYMMTALLVPSPTTLDISLVFAFVVVVAGIVVRHFVRQRIEGLRLPRL